MKRRRSTIKRVIPAMLVLAAMSCAVSPALARVVPGATYQGKATDFAKVTFTVSANGEMVTSYSITDVRGNTCTFSGDGVAGSWAGTPIVNGAFVYMLGSGLTFRGTFPGAQTASGTFQFHNNAVPGSAPACDSGVVSWTATTTAGGNGGSGKGGSGTRGSGTGPGAHTALAATHVTFGKLSRTRIGGRLRSSSKNCLMSRTVILMRGSKRITTTRTKANGTYSFVRSGKVRGQRVHVQVTARTLASTLCEAALSGAVKG
ncbi:MAG: hypothetical protein ACLP01_27695 [Solirubrobacteraceae bacterium]